MASYRRNMERFAADTNASAWLSARPRLCEKVAEDIRVLSSYFKTGAALLERLPPMPQRSAEQTKFAQLIHKRSRTLRVNFLALHSEWLYARLTHDWRIPKRLDELASAAAELCPGLVPASTDIEKERTFRQADKEGYEIDQALLFSAFLSSPKSGRHLISSMLRPTVRAQRLLHQFQMDARLDLGSVLIERKGIAAHLTINNGHYLNSEDDRLVEDLEIAVDLALLDNSVRVGVLRGGVMSHPRYAGRRVFSSGINLKALHAGQISFVNFLLRRELGLINKIYRGIPANCAESAMTGLDGVRRRLEKPWMAIVDGFAIGGGAQLLLVFDRVIAAAGSYFSLPAAQEGIIPGFAALRLSRYLGTRRARQVILFGRKISADEPDAKFIFDEVAESADLDEAIDRNINQLGNPAVAANRHMLNFVEEPLENYRQFASEFALRQAERLYSPDVLQKVEYDATR